MDDAACKKVWELLIDGHGKVVALPEEARDHLASCRECAPFVALLASLAPSGNASTPDYRAVDLALVRAQAIVRKRRERLQFTLFLAAALGVSAALATAGVLGYCLPILVFQGFAFIALPFAGFAALRRRAKGGSAWTV